MKKNSLLAILSTVALNLALAAPAPAVGLLAGWGSNIAGEINVPSGTFTAIAAGRYFSLAIRSDGTLVGWGTNAYGQLNVPSGTFTAVAAGQRYGTAIRSNGTLAAWGYNDSGQLNVPSGTFTAVAAGAFHGLAILSDGTLARWGDDGGHTVPSGTFTAVAAGWNLGLAIRSDGTLAGWGDNGYGQANVPSGTFTAVAAGQIHSLAIRSDGTLAGWGDNSYGQINVPSGTFTAVAAGRSHSLAIRSDGTLVGWGTFAESQVPPGTFTAVAAGDYHSLAISTGVPDATLTGAVSRKANPAGPGGVCDLALLSGVNSEPRQGGITELRLTFNVPPGGPGNQPVNLEEATCASPPYAAYSGASAISAVVAGNDLVLTFSPGLENARTYRLTMGPAVTSIPNQTVEFSGLVGDVNSDGFVNALDRSVVVGAWTGPGSFTCTTDIDSSGQTNATDRSIVVGAWTGTQNCAP